MLPLTEFKWSPIRMTGTIDIARWTFTVNTGATFDLIWVR